MKARLLFIIVVAVIVLLSISVFIFKKLSTPLKTHYHAGFVVFQNNKKIDFSDTKYMLLEPCVLKGANQHVDSDEDVQREKAHLHDNVGDVVHIERTGAIWKDLFTNIYYAIDYSKTEGFINGRHVVSYQLQPIHPFDSLVVFIGNNDANLLKQAITKEYMIKMAKKSTTCGD